MMAARTKQRKPDTDMTKEDVVLIPDVLDSKNTLIVHEDGLTEPIPKKKYSQEERKKLALALRLSGATFKVIGEQLGVDTQTATADVYEELEALGTEDLKTMRVIYQSRLEQLLATRWAKAVDGDDNALVAVLGILDRVERLYGLNGADTGMDHEEAAQGIIILGGDTSQHRAQLNAEKKKLNTR